MKAKAIATRHRGKVNRIWRAIKAWEQRFSGGFAAPFVFKRTDEPLPAARQPFHPAEWSSAKWQTTTYHGHVVLPTRKSKASSAKRSAISG